MQSGVQAVSTCSTFPMVVCELIFFSFLHFKLVIDVEMGSQYFTPTDLYVRTLLYTIQYSQYCAYVHTLGYNILAYSCLHTCLPIHCPIRTYSATYTIPYIHTNTPMKWAPYMLYYISSQQFIDLHMYVMISHCQQATSWQEKTFSSLKVSSVRSWVRCFTGRTPQSRLTSLHQLLSRWGEG